MRYLALATDYDGTLAKDGRVTESTLTALESLRASGRKLIMVTGRVLPELKTVFPALELFDRVVAENGSLLYDPATHEEEAIAEDPPVDPAQDLGDGLLGDAKFIGDFPLGRPFLPKLPGAGLAIANRLGRQPVPSPRDNLL